MSWKGDLLKAGISSNGTDIEIFRGSLTVRDGLATGTEASPLTITTSTLGYALYTTSAAESGTQRSVIIDHTQTGASATILEALRVNIDSEVRTGSWANAIVGRINYGSLGDSAGGMAAAICGEMNLAAKDMNNLGGGYYAIDAELNIPTGCVLMTNNTSRPVAFLNFGAWGGAVGEFDDKGYIFRTDGLTAGSGHILSANSRTLRILVEGTAKYLYLSNSEDDLGTMVVDSISVVVASADAINISGTASDCGIEIDAGCADGIRIDGACSDNGIEIVGNCTDSALQTVTGSFGYGVKLGGTLGYGISIGDCSTMAISALSQTQQVMQINSGVTLSSADINVVEITADSAANADHEMRTLYVSAYPSTAAQATAGLIAGYFLADVANALNTDFMKAVLAYLDLSAASTMATGGAGVHGIVNVDAATTVSAGSVAALKAQVLGDSALTGSLYCIVVDADMDVDAGIDIDCASSKTMGIGVNMTANGAITTGIAMTGAGGMTTGISLGAAMADGILISGACSDNGIEISGDCTGAGILMSGTNGVDIELPNGATLDNNAAGELTFTEDAIILVGAGHGKVQIGGPTDWGAGATGTLIDGTGWDWVSSTVGHVDSGALATACAAAYHALTVTPASHSTGSSFFGTWTELYLQATQDFANANNCAAVWGQIEAGATVTTSDVSGCFTAAGYFNVIFGDTMTNHTNHVINGVRTQLEISTTDDTNNGRIAAFECLKKSGTLDWDYGLYIADAVTAINLGACTTGINIAANTVVPQFMTIGTSANPIHWDGVASNILIYTENTDTTPSSTTANKLILSAAQSGAVTSGRLENFRAVVTSYSTNNITADLRGVVGQMELGDGVTYQGSTTNDFAGCFAMIASIYSGGNVTCNSGNLGKLYPLGIFFGLETGTSLSGEDSYVYIYNYGKVCPNSVIKLYNMSTPEQPTYFFDMQNAVLGSSSGPVYTGSLDDSGDNNILCDGHIKILVGSTPYYIPIYDTLA